MVQLRLTATTTAHTQGVGGVKSLKGSHARVGGFAALQWLATETLPVGVLSDVGVVAHNEKVKQFFAGSGKSALT
jgi:hypothetical protein